VLEAPQLNAFATPAGTSSSRAAWWRKMRNEAELAGVLAHEIVHVLKKHHLKAIQKTAQLELANTAVTTFARQDRTPPRARSCLPRAASLGARLDKSDELEADRSAW